VYGEPNWDPDCGCYDDGLTGYHVEDCCGIDPSTGLACLPGGADPDCQLIAECKPGDPCCKEVPMGSGNWVLITRSENILCASALSELRCSGPQCGGALQERVVDRYCDSNSQCVQTLNSDVIIQDWTTRYTCEPGDTWYCDITQAGTDLAKPYCIEDPTYCAGGPVQCQDECDDYCPPGCDGIDPDCDVTSSNGCCSWRTAEAAGVTDPDCPTSCVPDGCNNICPYLCTVQDDPDCGCLSGNGCCAPGCNYLSDNDCSACVLTPDPYVQPSSSGFTSTVTATFYSISDGTASIYCSEEDGVVPEVVPISGGTATATCSYGKTDDPRVYMVSGSGGGIACSPAVIIHFGGGAGGPSIDLKQPTTLFINGYVTYTADPVTGDLTPITGEILQLDIFEGEDEELDETITGKWSLSGTSIIEEQDDIINGVVNYLWIIDSGDLLEIGEMYTIRVRVQANSGEEEMFFVPYIR